MTHVARRKKRLAQLIELAQSYRGWSRRELARALGRDRGPGPAHGLFHHGNRIGVLPHSLFAPGPAGAKQSCT